jgi:hypothetical protein
MENQNRMFDAMVEKRLLLIMTKMPKEKLNNISLDLALLQNLNWGENPRKICNLRMYVRARCMLRNNPNQR